MTLKLLFQGSVAITGAAVKWLRDNLNVISSASEIGKIFIIIYYTAKLILGQGIILAVNINWVSEALVEIKFI